MPYIRNKDSIINGADACGGGMKKQGLVYKSDWSRIKGATGEHGGHHLGKAANKDYVFRMKMPGDCRPVKAVSTYAVVRRTLLNN
jgi:hypothetical protein